VYSTYKILSNFFVFLKLENYLPGKMKIPKFLSVIFLFPSTKMQIPKEIQIQDDTGDNKKIQEIQIQEDTGNTDTRGMSGNFGSKRKTHQNIVPVSHFTREVLKTSSVTGSLKKVYFLDFFLTLFHSLKE
jgi:hypothetical protein